MVVSLNVTCNFSQNLIFFKKFVSLDIFNIYDCDIFTNTSQILKTDIIDFFFPHLFLLAGVKLLAFIAAVEKTAVILIAILHLLVVAVF